MATINVKDSSGATVAIEKPLTPGAALSVNSKPFVLASDHADIPIKAGSTEIKITAATLQAGGSGFIGWLSQIANLIAAGAQTVKVAVTPTVTASTYAVSKVIGGIMTFALILPPTTFDAMLESITVKFKGSLQTVGFWVAIFDTSPVGTFTDAATAAINAADTAHLLGMYHITGNVSLLGTHTVVNRDGIMKALVGASQSLFVVVVPDATTAALGSTTDMTVELGMLWG